MKTLFLFLICIFPIIACTQTNVSALESRLSDYTDRAHTEAQTRSFIENYIRDLNDPDWSDKIGPYLRHLEFIDAHKVFRNALQNYHFEIKHLTVRGNEGMIWGVVTANHVSELNDPDFKMIPASNKKVTWEEVWYYTVEDGKKFGEDFELIHNDLQRMEAFNITCLPD